MEDGPREIPLDQQHKEVISVKRDFLIKTDQSVQKLYPTKQLYTDLKNFKSESILTNPLFFTAFILQVKNCYLIIPPI